MEFKVAIEIDGEFVSVTGLFSHVVDTSDDCLIAPLPGKIKRGALIFRYIADGSCPVYRFLKKHPNPGDIKWSLAYSLGTGSKHHLRAVGVQLITNIKTGIHTLKLKMPESEPL